MGNAIPGQTLSQSLAVDYDPTEDMIYWSTYQSKTISRVRRSGTGVWIFIRGHDTWKNTKIWMQMMLLLASFVLIVFGSTGPSERSVTIWKQSIVHLQGVYIIMVLCASRRTMLTSYGQQLLGRNTSFHNSFIINA